MYLLAPQLMKCKIMPKLHKTIMYIMKNVHYYYLIMESLSFYLYPSFVPECCKEAKYHLLHYNV